MKEKSRKDIYNTFTPQKHLSLIYKELQCNKKSNRKKGNSVFQK